MSKVATSSFILALSVFLSSCADEGSSIQQLYNIQPLEWSAAGGGRGAVYKVSSEVESAADKLYSRSLDMLKQLDVSPEAVTQFCNSDNTAVITVYSTNGRAQNEIDVKLDGSRIGSLTTYYPNDEPGCKTPSAEGVITVMVPAGDHTLEAASSNLTWPSHNFSVEKCECMSLPLS